MKSCALIVTFNRLEKLKKCIEASRNAGFEIIVVVDNCSTDGTGSWLQKIAGETLKVLTPEKNIGGAGGFYYGLSYVIEKITFDWLFLYDDDAYPRHDVLTEFHRVQQNQPYQPYQAYCAKVLDSAGGRCKMNAPFRRFPVSFIDSVHYAFSRNDFIADENVQSDVVSLSFVGAILSPVFIKDNLKYLYPELFIYFDDVYFSYGAVMSGAKICYTPTVMFTHDVLSAGKALNQEWKVYYLIRNQILGFKLFKDNPPFCRFAIFIRVLKYAFSLFKQRRKKVYFKYLIEGIRHGLTGKMGKYPFS